jgi:hypothetical protein
LEPAKKAVLILSVQGVPDLHDAGSFILSDSNCSQTAKGKIIFFIAEDTKYKKMLPLHLA